jgi:acyl carrier protein
VEREAVLQAVREAAAARAGVDVAQVHEGTSFDADLQLDSLSLVELTADVEEAVGGRLLELAELGGVGTVGAFADVVAGAVTA